ncbi:MAG: primosomal protein N' [Cystobacterineae bacterium]|nr:primosomal protein N' [Cystobacterineae bacterium]
MRVAVARPLLRTFLYEGPEGVQLKPGQRLLVPLGNSKVLGFFLGWEERPPQASLKPIEAVLEEVPALTEEVYALVRFAAKHYRAPLGEALKTALPPGLNVPKPALPTKRRKPKPMPRIGEVLERPAQLSAEQREVLEVVLGGLGKGVYQAFLLQGVTGSGKTEVYLRVVEKALEQGMGALVLVPEIALTPQLSGRFEERFGQEVALLHSGMGEAERRFHFWALREGRARVALGVRSAIFAPIKHLGVVVVDEEHDNSFKQEEGLRYNAKDLALVRGQQAKATVILGSATPSLESLYNVEAGKMRLLHMRQRIYNRPLPDIQLVDLKALLAPPAQTPPPLTEPLLQACAREKLPTEAPSPPEALPLQESEEPTPEEVSLLTPALHKALEELLLSGQQAILFLNRRGYNRMWLCSSCGKTRKCRHCDICMSYHFKVQKLQCHCCGWSEALPELCEECGGTFLKLGFGTERIEEELTAAFPAARMARLDRDTSVSPRKLTALLERFSKGEVDVLIGTQMITKGHDFHGVTLVCMLLADMGLSLPDFRASERVFHLLTQVSGRAGRGERPGKVLLQTYYPKAEPIAYMLRRDFEGFARMEMARRKMLAWPPFSRVVLLRIEGKNPSLVERFSRQLACAALEAISRSPSNVRVLGPSSAPISKVSDKYRWQLFLKAPSYAALELPLCAVEQVVATLPNSIKVVIDVDPATML